MRDEIKDFDNFLKKLVDFFSITKRFAAFTGICTLIASTLTFVVGFKLNIVMSAIISGSLLLNVYLGFTYYKNIYFSRKYEILDPNIRINNSESEYAVFGDGSYELSEHLYATSLVERYREYHHRLRWTGDRNKTALIETFGGDDVRVSLDETHERYTFVNFYFAKEKERGEKFDFGFKIRIFDGEIQSDQVFCRNFNRLNISKGKMRLLLPVEFKGREIDFRVHKGTLSGMPKVRERRMINDISAGGEFAVIEADIENPRDISLMDFTELTGVAGASCEGERDMVQS